MLVCELRERRMEWTATLNVLNQLVMKRIAHFVRWRYLCEAGKIYFRYTRQTFDKTLKTGGKREARFSHQQNAEIDEFEAGKSEISINIIRIQLGSFRTPVQLTPVVIRAKFQSFSESNHFHCSNLTAQKCMMMKWRLSFRKWIWIAN